MSSTNKTENLKLNIWSPNDTSKREDFNIDNQIIDDFAEEVYSEFTELKSDSYPIVEATGTNAYVGASARIKAVGKGTRCTLFVGTASNGNCSLNLNNSGAVAIKDSNGNVVTNLKANIPYNLCHNGSDFILQGKGGGGNLIPKYLLAGYYGEGDNGRVDGTMVNRGAPTTNLNAGGTYNLQEGYYSGGTITANSLASQTAGNATAAQILAGYSAWVNGVLLNGGMANRGAVSATLNAGGSYTIPAGYHNGSGKVTANSLAGQTSANATAAQILSGYTAWVNGTKLTGTYAYGKLVYSGTVTVANGGDPGAITVNRIYFVKTYEQGTSKNFFSIIHTISGLPRTIPLYAQATGISNVVDIISYMDGSPSSMSTHAYCYYYWNNDGLYMNRGTASSMDGKKFDYYIYDVTDVPIWRMMGFI